MARTWFGPRPPRRACRHTNPAAAGTPSSSSSSREALPVHSEPRDHPSTLDPARELDSVNEDEKGESPPGNLLGCHIEEWHRLYSREEIIMTDLTLAAYIPEDKKNEYGDLRLGEELDKVESTAPFSASKQNVQQRVTSIKSNPERDIVRWTPSNQPRLRRAPPLLDLCLRTLTEDGEEIESLEGLPDSFKHKIVMLLCSSHKMSARLLGTYLNESTTEIRLSDCSWVSEEVFQDAFANCSINLLKVVLLDLCGRCMSDYVLQTVLDKSQNRFTSLVTLSLKGAYRITDNFLSILASSAPSLRSINLGKCSLITSLGIIILAEKLNLEELYIDYCVKIDVQLILPVLEQLEHLKVLSLAGVPTVSDSFVLKLMRARGYNMRELVFAGCQKLTTKSVSAIGSYCPQLRGLDIQGLKRLSDSALEYLANGCRSVTTLKLRQNPFSDEAIAAFLETSGGSLTELSLSNVAKVAHRTAISISLECRLNLQSLDLSFCRQLTDKELGFIVDSCPHLTTLKLFGCTEVTKKFLQGHRNSQVKIIGLTGSILDDLEMPKFI